jgi:hypothetical protein
VHALHTVHAVPDLRIAAGRFAGRSFEIISRFGTCLIEIIDLAFLMSRPADLATVKVRELKATNPFRSPFPVDPYRVKNRSTPACAAHLLFAPATQNIVLLSY